MFEKLCTTILRDYLYLLFFFTTHHQRKLNVSVIQFNSYFCLNNICSIVTMRGYTCILPLGRIFFFEKKSRNACSEKSHSNKVNDIFICFYLMKRQVAKISLKGLFSTKIMTLLPVCEMMTLILIKSSKQNVCQMLL